MGRLNLWVDQGATFREVLELKESDGTTPRDLSGWTARMQVRHRVATPALVDLVPAVNGTSGTVTIALTAAQTASLPPGRAVYDVRLVAPSGDIEKVVYGALFVAGQVTR